MLLTYDWLKWNLSNIDESCSDNSLLDQTLQLLCAAKSGILESEVTELLGAAANVVVLQLVCCDWVVRYNGKPYPLYSEHQKGWLGSGLLWLIHKEVRETVSSKIGNVNWEIHSKLAAHIGHASTHKGTSNHGWRFCQVQPQHLFVVMLTPLKPRLTRVQVCQNEVATPLLQANCTNLILIFGQFIEAGTAVSKAAHPKDLEAAEEHLKIAEVLCNVLSILVIK